MVLCNSSDRRMAYVLYFLLAKKYSFQVKFNKRLHQTDHIPTCPLLVLKLGREEIIKLMRDDRIPISRNSVVFIEDWSAIFKHSCNKSSLTLKFPFPFLFFETKDPIFYHFLTEKTRSAFVHLSSTQREKRRRRHQPKKKKVKILIWQDTPFLAESRFLPKALTFSAIYIMKLIFKSCITPVFQRNEKGFLLFWCYIRIYRYIFIYKNIYFRAFPQVSWNSHQPIFSFPQVHLFTIQFYLDRLESFNLLYCMWWNCC